MNQDLYIENTYHWPADGEIRPWTEFWVTSLLGPVGSVQSASILFSLDEGQTWTDQAMERSCYLGDQEVWHVNLGTLPAGTHVRYAVEAVDQEGQSIWDNACGKDHYARIGTEKDQIPA